VALGIVILRESNLDFVNNRLQHGKERTGCDTAHARGGFCRNQAWLLKNSFGAFALKTRRARMPYKRFSPPRDTFLVTQFRQLRHFKGLFQQPQAITQAIREQ
jgi:hypothetical protein